VKMEYEEGKCIASSQAALAPYHDDWKISDLHPQSKSWAWTIVHKDFENLQVKTIIMINLKAVNTSRVIARLRSWMVISALMTLSYYCVQVTCYQGARALWFNTKLQVNLNGTAWLSERVALENFSGFLLGLVIAYELVKTRIKEYHDITCLTIQTR
jgi:hypothetical protein